MEMVIHLNNGFQIAGTLVDPSKFDFDADKIVAVCEEGDNLIQLVPRHVISYLVLHGEAPPEELIGLEMEIHLTNGDQVGGRRVDPEIFDADPKTTLVVYDFLDYWFLLFCRRVAARVVRGARHR